MIQVLYEDARRAADMMRDRGPGYVDCHIAAAALRTESLVMAYNQRDFSRTRGDSGGTALKYEIRRAFGN